MSASGVVASWLVSIGGNIKTSNSSGDVGGLSWPKLTPAELAAPGECRNKSMRPGAAYLAALFVLSASARNRPGAHRRKHHSHRG